MFPAFLGGLMEGLLGSGAAGGMAGGGMMNGMLGASGAGAMGGGMAAGAAPAAVGNVSNVIGNIGGNNATPEAVANVANAVGKVGQMPSVGGMQGGSQAPGLPGLMQAQAPGHQNDPLMQGGGMWQRMYGGGI